MIVLLLAFMLLLAGLVLASAIPFFKRKHHHNTHARNLSQKIQSESSFSANSSCQTCHLCGGLRLRPRNAASFDYSSVSKSHSRHLDEGISRQFRPIRHQWASMRIQVLVNIKQAVQKLISHHKKQAHVDLFTKLASSSNILKRKAKPQSRDVCVVSTALPLSEGSSQCSPGSSLCIDSTVSNGNAVAAINEFDKVDAQDTQKSTESEPRDAPVHRVVLEILVSPSGNSKENICAISPSIKLKLETSATLGSSAGRLESLKDIDRNKFEHTSDIAQLLHGANDALPKTFSSSCAHGDHSLNQIFKEALLVSKDEIKSPDFVTIADKDPMLNSIAPNKGFQTLVGPKDCPQCCHILGDNMEHEASESATSIARKNYALCGQLKFRGSNALCESTVSNVAMQHMVNNKKGSEMASGVSLSNLGSLHISFLKSSEQEDNTDVNCQVGSMLASLNVTDKFTGDTSLSSVKKEKPNKTLPCDLLDTGCSHSSSFISVAEAEGICNETLVKKEDCCPLQGSTDTSSSKRNKKKKKTKGKKPKVKVDASVVDSGTMQEIGKVALEAAKHVSAVSKRELGCVCGAVNGNLHKESCPYPFISSGSMLQRKMREQYNDLVKSNAAKTLTLAQVGQFTSCLVEAKATLKQKSETIQRKYTITKSLLSKADKSSFDRLCSQIYGLEMEQKKLEEDTIVYNRLQEQLKLSPAYQKMLEYGRAHFELQPHTGQIMEKLDPEDSEISFEEFLEQEKKDAFWQRHNLARSALSAS